MLEIGRRKAHLLCHYAVGVSGRSKALDVAKQLKCGMIPSGDVFDETHHQTLVFRCVYYVCGNGAASERLYCFKPSLSTHKVEHGRAARHCTGADSNRLFQSNRSNVFHQCLFLTFATHPRIEHPDTAYLNISDWS